MPPHPTRRYVGVVVLATLALTQGPGAHVSAAGAGETTQSALNVVRSSVARVSGAAGSGGSRRSESERVETRHVAATLFDAEAMARRMLARHWNDGSAPQQAEFIRLLAELLERALGDVIVSEPGAVTIFDAESIDGSYAQVRSRVVSDRGPDISIEYRLSKSGERWVVYDVLREGASLVLDYRGQFSSILRTSSFAELLERLRGNEMDAQFAAEDSENAIMRLMLFQVVAGRRGLR
jgi:phospholipid transport system substrate-binding protein